MAHAESCVRTPARCTAVGVDSHPGPARPSLGEHVDCRAGVAAAGGASVCGFAGTGIAGNSGSDDFGINLLARWDRDVLAVPGARYVVVFEGINDIGMAGQDRSPTADELIGAHRQLIERAHTDGLLVCMEQR